MNIIGCKSASLIRQSKRLRWGVSRGDYSFFHGLPLLTNYIYWRIEPVLIGTRQKIPIHDEGNKITLYLTSTLQTVIMA